MRWADMRFKVDEKVALVGGGMANGFFYVATFKGYGEVKGEPAVPGSRQAILDMSEMKGLHKMSDTFTPWVTETKQGLPMGGSTWRLAELNSLSILPHGYYFLSGEEIYNCSNMGFFSSPYNQPVIARLGDGGWALQ